MLSYWILWVCIFLAAGFVTGLFSRLFEIGGIVRVPIFFFLFILLGIDYSIAPFMAVGTSLAVSIPSSVVSFRRQYREWVDEDDQDQITEFLLKWLPFLALGVICGAVIVRFISGWFLIGAFTATILFLAVQVFVLRGSYILFERFPNPLVEWLVALITGAVSVLAGISGTLIGSVLKAFSYPWESTFAAAAAGIMVSLIGTGGFMINGPAFSKATPLAVGYVDIAAAVSALAGMFLASPIGRWLNVHHRLHTFKKHIAADRFIEPFSGLCSRQYFDAMLDYSVANSSRLSEPLSLMIIDIYDLSMITKKHGQKLANHILASMSETLRESIREPDLVSRYGGDEFYVILLGASKEASIAASNRIMTRFKGENINIESDGEKMPVSFSIGVSTYSMVTPAMIDKVSLVEQAKRAMHESKRNGKNRITHYECMPG